MADENDENMFIVPCVLHDLVSDFQRNFTHLGIIVEVPLKKCYVEEDD